jgi:hypothetical protein
MSSQEVSTDVLIVGGGTGGVAAALGVARTGARCIVTEPTDWVGGQLTAQAVPPDENRWMEGKEGIRGASGSYLEYRERVRRWYRANRRLTPAARADAHLNPGNGWVSWLSHEPKVGHTVLQDMLAPHVASGAVTILLHTAPVRVDVDGDQVRAVTVRNEQTGKETTVRFKYVLDATECGDLLVMANVERAVGSEHQGEYGEPHARADRADPLDHQAISWCFALEHDPNENHTIARPAKYAWWRDYTPQLDKPWPGKLFSWTQVGGDEHKARYFRWVPWPDEPNANEWEMWRYRRIVDRSVYEPRSADGWSPPPDVALVNMVQMDYWQRPTLGVSPADRQTAFDEAKEQGRCFLYWMQTEAPRHDSATKTGYPGLKLRGEELGTEDGFAKTPYIREAVRLKARTVVHEGHVNTEMRKGVKLPTDIPAPLGMAEPFWDSVGIGNYRLDLHPSTAHRASIYVPAAPFRIPMGALIPVRVRNLLAAGKNLGVTHVTNGCYRLHPVEWNVGESAGTLAAWCVREGKEPQQVHEDRASVRAFQKLLTGQRVVLGWPWEGGVGLE